MHASVLLEPGRTGNQRNRFGAICPVAREPHGPFGAVLLHMDGRGSGAGADPRLVVSYPSEEGS